MEETLPVVEVTVKYEPIDSDNSGGDDQNGNIQPSEVVKEEELCIKPEPQDDDSQDAFIKEDDPGTLSENESRLDEETPDYEYKRNRQSNAPSRKQILVFLDFLNEHRDLANCMLRGPAGRVRANQLWETITERLNRISGCFKTTQQWQRVWSDKKYLTRKAAAIRYSSIAAGGAALAPELTLQDERILAIIGEPIPPRRVYPKTGIPEPNPQTPKQPQDVSVVPAPSTVELESSPGERLSPHLSEVQIQPRKPYTPRKADSSRKEESRKSNIQQPDVPSTPVIVPDGLHQPEASEPPDEPPKPGDELDDLPSSASISDPLSPTPIQRGQNRQGRVRYRAGLDPYTQKLFHVEERRLKNDLKRNEELRGIKNAIQEMVGIVQEMVGLVKQFTEKDNKK